MQPVDCFVRNNADVKLPLHRHDDARIILILDGEVRETDLSGRQVYRRGDVLFRPPFCIHENAASGASNSFLRLPVSRKVWFEMVRQYGWRPLRGKIKLDGPLSANLCGDALAARLTPHNTEAVANARLKRPAQMQPYEFTRRFVRQYGLTPTTFRRENRLRHAFSLMMFGENSLANIAAECCYADQSHFSRDIKSATGHSPQAFRAVLQS